MDVCHGVFNMGHATALGAELDDAVVFASGLDHAAAFDDVMAGRFFGVDVLAGLAGEDCDQGVPVVGGGVDDGVDGFVVQEASEIFLGAGGFAGDFFDGLEGLGEHGVVDIAEGDDLDGFVAGEFVGEFGASVAEADDGDAYAVVGGGEGRFGGEGEGSGRAEESASVDGGHGGGPRFDQGRTGVSYEE